MQNRGNPSSGDTRCNAVLLAEVVAGLGHCTEATDAARATAALRELQAAPGLTRKTQRLVSSALSALITYRYYAEAAEAQVDATSSKATYYRSERDLWRDAVTRLRIALAERREVGRSRI